MEMTSFEYSNYTFTVKYDPSDNSGLACINEIVNTNEYILNNFKDAENKVFMDIGANIGIATIIMAKLNPKSIVYSFEPFEKSFNLLLENIKLNNLANVKAFNMAVSKKSDTKLTLTISNIMTGANSTHSDLHKFYDYWRSNEQIQVDCISLDEILTKNGIKEVYLLKIDCEGAEFDILYESELFKTNIVKNMVGEFHDLRYITSEKRSQALIDYCKPYVNGIFKILISDS